MKQLILIHILLLFTTFTFAQKIGVEKVYDRACSFINIRKVVDNKVADNKRKSIDKSGDSNSYIDNYELTLAESTSDNIYIWNIGNDNGFVILGNDERIKDVIGYSDEGHFDATNMPEAMAEWIYSWNNYIVDLQRDSICDEQAEQATDSYSSYNQSASDDISYTTTSTSLPAITPLLHCKWGQSSPYNLQCPEYATNTRSVAGCVATAMAQTLYYYKPTGCTKLDGYTSNKNDINIDLDDLPATTFNWIIIQSIYKNVSDAASNEVAKLMRYCGQSCKSNYGKTTSANVSDACTALRYNFNFSSSTKLITRSNFTSNHWISILYNELSEGRIILMAGHNQNAGHAFVCDGYDGNGLFHINWGWNGLSNGYFMLDYLSPASQGTGSSTGGYSWKNYAIVGMKLNDGHCSADDISEDSHGNIVNYTVNSMELESGKEKVVYNITYKISITNNGTILSTPLKVYVDDNTDPLTVIGVNIDRNSTGYAYFFVSFSTAGTHTIYLKNTYNKLLYAKTITIEDVPEYSLNGSYANITKVTNGIINQNYYTFKYYLTNNSTCTYDDYVKFSLMKIATYKTDASGNKTPNTAVLMNSKFVPMNVAYGSKGSCTYTFDDLDDGEEYYVKLMYITKSNGTVAWTGKRTAYFTCQIESETEDKIDIISVQQPNSQKYSINGTATTMPHGIYIMNGNKYIYK